MQEARERLRALAQSIESMGSKLDLIIHLNGEAKRNEAFKEQLHQQLREYLSWKN